MLFSFPFGSLSFSFAFLLHLTQLLYITSILFGTIIAFNLLGSKLKVLIVTAGRLLVSRNQRNTSSEIYMLLVKA